MSGQWWRRSGLAPLVTAEMVSAVGTGMTALALPWLVLESTGSTTRAGVVGAAELLPGALLGIPSGAVVARLGPLRTMVCCELLRAPALAMIPILYWSEALPFGVFVALAFVVGALFPAYYSSQRSTLPLVLGDASDDVTRGNALLGGAMRFGLVAGPLLAAGVIAWADAAAVLLVDAGTHLAAGVLLMTARPGGGGRGSEAPPAVLAGVRSLAADRSLRSLTCANAGVEFLMQAVFLALPILAFTVYEERAGVGAGLLGAWGAGALLGAIPALRLAKVDAIRVLRVAFVVQTVPLAVLAVDAPPAVLGLALLVSGIASPIVNAPAAAAVSLGVRDEVRDTAMLAFVTITIAAGSVGFLLMGPAVTAIGLRGAVASACGVAAAAVVIFLVATRERGGLRGGLSVPAHEQGSRGEPGAE